jgi:hypothetical protein
MNTSTNVNPRLVAVTILFVVRLFIYFYKLFSEVVKLKKIFESVKMNIRTKYRCVAYIVVN